MYKSKPSKKKVCRTCKVTVKGKMEAALHNCLCMAMKTSYSGILSNINNYERPGRERFSKHHQYRPSSDRPHRSKSVPAKRFGPPVQQLGKTLKQRSPHRSQRHSSSGKPRSSRSKSIPPSGRRREDVCRSPKQRLPMVLRGSAGGQRGSRSLNHGESSSRCSKWGTPLRGRVAGGKEENGGAVLVSGSTLPSMTSPSGGKGRGLNSSWRSSRLNGRKKLLEPNPASRQCSLSPDSLPFNGNGRWPRRWRHQSEGVVQADEEGFPRLRSTSVNRCMPQGSSDRMGQVSGVDGVKKMRRSMDNFKPFFYDSESVPTSHSVSRRRFCRGKRGYFSCKIGCSCRKCHYFNLSMMSGRQSSFLRRCRADCSCTKCHLCDATKFSPDSSPSKVKHSADSSREYTSAASVRRRTRKERSPRTIRSRNCMGRTRRPSASQDGSAKYPSTPKRKLGDARDASVARVKKDACQAEREPSTPKRKRERKEVHYKCEPCGMDLQSWYLIRKHLLSSDHLQAVSRNRRNLLKRLRPGFCGLPATENSQVAEPAWDDRLTTRTPQEHLMAGLNLMRIKNCSVDMTENFQPFSAVKNNCSVPAEPVAVPEAAGLIEGASDNWKKSSPISTIVAPNGHSSSVEEVSPSSGSSCHAGISQVNEADRSVSLAPSTKKLIIHHSARVQDSHNSEGQQTTFIRIDYNKKLPRNLKDGCVKYPHREGSLDHRVFELASIKGSVYNCAKVKQSDLPQPFVDMGPRCDSKGFKADVGGVSPVPTFNLIRDFVSETPVISEHSEVHFSSVDSSWNGQLDHSEKKMIRVDYNQKSSLLPNDVTHPAGSLTYIGPGHFMESMSPCSTTSIHSLVDEEALGERLHLSDSEDSKDCEITGVGPVMDGADQVVILDSQRFLDLLVQQLNDGGLSCNRCGNKIDGNSIVKQIYSCSGKSQTPGINAGASAQ